MMGVTNKIGDRDGSSSSFIATPLIFNTDDPETEVVQSSLCSYYRLELAVGGLLLPCLTSSLVLIIRVSVY